MIMWRDIAGFEGLYQVSDEGQIRNARTAYVLKPRKDADGYLLVTIWRGKPVEQFEVKLHREVAKAFIPNPGNKPQVNHLDGNRANATLSNLEWATCSENHFHSFRELGRKVGNEKAIVAENADEKKHFESLKAAERAGFNRRGIQHCLSGNYAQHRGYTWRTTNG